MSDETDTMGVLIGFGSRRSISSAEELDVLLDDVTSYANDEDLAVAISIFYPDDENDRSASVLHIGVGRDYSMLEYGDGQISQYVLGKGTESTWWYFMCDFSEVPAGRKVPVDLSRSAAREFVRTRGERPKWFNWIDESSDVPLIQAS